jgi:hypothetical protein
MIGIIDSNQKIVTNGLIVHFDAAQLRSYPGSGATWSDISGSGISGSLNNGPTFSSEYGGSIRLDGINDDITFSAIPPSALTVIAWVRSSLTNWNQSRCISLQSTANGYYILPTVNTKNVTFSLDPGETSIGTVTVSNIAIPNMYTISTNGSNSHKAYLNDTEVASSTTSLFRPTQTISRTWYLGSDPNASNRRLDGYFYNYLVYNRQLSESEIVQNYNAIKSRFGL